MDLNQIQISPGLDVCKINWLKFGEDLSCTSKVIANSVKCQNMIVHCQHAQQGPLGQNNHLGWDKQYDKLAQQGLQGQECFLFILH